jgi:hypothetical protein
MKNTTQAAYDAEDARLNMEIAQNKMIQQIIMEEQAPMRLLYEWKAPERVYTQRTRKWYVGVAVIAMLIIAYSALTANVVLIFLVIAMMLVIYSLASIPPHEITNKITNKGLNVFDNLYIWRNFIYFWVTKRGNEHVIHLEFKEKYTDVYYQRMILLTGKGDLKQIVFELLKHIDYLNSGSGGILSKWVEGEFIPLLRIIDVTSVAEAEMVKDIEDEQEEKEEPIDAKSSQKTKN